MACVRARVDRDAEELSWRAYVAESLRLIPQRQHLRDRWVDGVLHKAAAPEADPVRIAEHIISAAGLKFA